MGASCPNHLTRTDKLSPKSIAQWCSWGRAVIYSARLDRGATLSRKIVFFRVYAHGITEHLPKSKGALNIMKCLAPIRLVSRTNTHKHSGQHNDVRDFVNQIFAPSRTFSGFAVSRKIPRAKRKII